MMLSFILTSDLSVRLALPLLIFLARIVDESIGTVRVIFISRGLKYHASVAGFFELLVWLLATGQLMMNLSDPLCYVAYAAGHAAGTFLGIILEERSSTGKVTVRLVSQRDFSGAFERIAPLAYAVTISDETGPSGPVKVVSASIDRHDLATVLGLAAIADPAVLYSVADLRSANDEGEPLAPARSGARLGALRGILPLHGGHGA